MISEKHYAIFTACSENEKSLLREEVQQALNSGWQLGRRISCNHHRRSREEDRIIKDVEALREEVHRFDRSIIQFSVALASGFIASQLCVLHMRRELFARAFLRKRYPLRWGWIKG